MTEAEILNLSVPAGTLARLLGKSRGSLDYWLRKGLPREPDGRFKLALVLRWTERYYYHQRTPQIRFPTLTQEQLATVLGVRRQTIWNWSRAGLPKNQDGSYSLRRFLPWLRGFYQQRAESKYQARLAALERKLGRNLAQLQRFVSRAKAAK